MISWVTFLSIKIKIKAVLQFYVSVNTERHSRFYLNCHFIDNTLTHFLEVRETRVAR